MVVAPRTAQKPSSSYKRDEGVLYGRAQCHERPRKRNAPRGTITITTAIRREALDRYVWVCPPRALPPLGQGGPTLLQQIRSGTQWNAFERPRSPPMRAGAYVWRAGCRHCDTWAA